MSTGSGSQVNDVVRPTDGVLVVLDDDHGVSKITQTFERSQESVVVFVMQSDRRLVQDVEHAAEARANLGRQADALALTSRQSVGRA